MEIKKISLSSIVFNQHIMPREQIDENYVNDLVEDLRCGVVFPPVDLFYNGKRYLLADGCHRFKAAKKFGNEDIKAVIYDGDEREALLHASGANACHGKRRTNQDKRKGVKNLLMDPEWRGWSDNRIAEHCKVSQPFVSKIRNEINSTYNN